ncbi:MAG: alpha/beta hydrolase family protein [Clostridia bacterium]|nr:alpha/beta hydrolase family protein [Clostridia bacterium]
MAWLTINFKSDALNMPVMMDALIPQGHGNYKSLYLLHGAGGNHSSWLLKTRIADYVDKTDIAVFMPSGNNKFYVDNVNGRNYHTFITKELPEKCETWFNLDVSRENRFIAGMSMGGYGAMYAALNRPDLYRAAFSYSGLLNILERYDNPQGLDLYVPFGTRQQLIDNGFDLYDLLDKKYGNNIENECGKACGNHSGKIVENPACAIDNNVDKSVDYVDNFPEIILECGLSDSRIHMTRDFYKATQDAGLKPVLYEEEGKHDFTYWDRCIERTVNYISKGGIYGSN